jgi:large-conductance mechanosensitive channel
VKTNSLYDVLLLLYIGILIPFIIIGYIAYIALNKIERLLKKKKGEEDDGTD